MVGGWAGPPGFLGSTSIDPAWGPAPERRLWGCRAPNLLTKTSKMIGRGRTPDHMEAGPPGDAGLYSASQCPVGEVNANATTAGICTSR